MERVVIDSNVFVKWFIEEEYSESALLLRNDHIAGCIKILAPRYALLEAGDALRKYYVRRLIEREDAIMAINLLTSFDIDFIDMDNQLVLEAAKYSLANDVTLYDAYYIVLARREGAEMYTADKKLLARLRNKEPLVHHISEYKPRC